MGDVPPSAQAMRILHLCPGADTGGQSYQEHLAVARHAPDSEVRSVVVSTTYLGYGVDLRWRDGVVEELYAKADVVVIHNNLVPYFKLDQGQKKPIVLYHHGTRFRQDPEAGWAAGEAIGAVQVCSTADLTTIVPRGKRTYWMPQLVDVDAMQRIRAWHYRPSQKIRIAHAPTDRLIKSTPLVIEVVERLSRRYPVELVLIERQRWEDCLARKATADIYVDQLKLGYGGNAVEAWAMGIPVIAGAEDPRVLAKMRRLHGDRDLPFAEATEDTFEEVLERLVRDSAYRAERAARGMAHVLAHHEWSVRVPRLLALYATIPASVGGPSRAEQAAALARRRSSYVPRRLRRRAGLALRRRHYPEVVTPAPQPPAQEGAVA